MNAKTAAAMIGIAFLAAGIIGFFPNPLISADGYFVVNRTHNVVHLISGAVLLAGLHSSLGAEMALKIVGVVYALIVVLDWAIDGPMLLGLVAMNPMDYWLHVMVAVVVLAAGFRLNDEIPA